MNKLILKFALTIIKIQQRQLKEKEARIKYFEGFLKGKGY